MLFDIDSLVLTQFNSLVADLNLHDHIIHKTLYHNTSSTYTVFSKAGHLFTKLCKTQIHQQQHQGVR